MCAVQAKVAAKAAGLDPKSREAAACRNYRQLGVENNNRAGNLAAVLKDVRAGLCLCHGV